MHAARRPPRALVDFLSEDGRPPLRLAFEGCREVLRADTLAEVRTVLQAAERHAAAGAWCVGFVRYEAAPAFDAAFEVHPADGPLVWFGVFDSAAPWPDAPAAGAWSTGPWQSELARAAFDARIARIHQAIRGGETYQINLTEPLSSGFQGEAEAWFRALQREQPQGYAAFIDTGEEQLLSVSPELFFDWDGERIRSRPMKGTAPRGDDALSDARQAAALLASEKERAENLMIVDLIRNDLSRIARPHSVKVEQLFQARAWPTVWQMTSDVLARTREGTGLVDVFEALFPCGSVTGVPKVRATGLIRSLETAPRGVYCGAAGVLRPGGGAIFNVPIRTVQLRDGRAVCGIGSGITIDARPEGEWDEWRNKRRFLEAAAAPFTLIETLRLEGGVFIHGDAHLARLQASAAHFGFGWDGARVRQALDGLLAGHAEGAWRVRLLLDAAGQPKAEAFAFAPTATPVRIRLATRPMETVHPDFLRHKTSRRAHYSRFEPTEPGIFDTLLHNTDGEVTEFTRGNLAALTPDGDWITPPLSAGLLPGVGRGRWLAEGRIREARLTVDALPQMRALAFVNSLRGWLPAELVD
ncbi:aminodeoxychorismate synthase component I [Xylophilus rhododendri]|uniref:Aminodeoxychorismate synthase component I n=1 Tax=Xylophilus rhododendri TaxID=2697032 RepID=A0A857J7K3_9BURK|nr:aminodeoxychorismate synthase component I [Xylophilus rhododendri]QHI99059.1 aminodeoxychorismate synthase component I [Xylophilus rhododendri]